MPFLLKILVCELYVLTHALRMIRMAVLAYVRGTGWSRLVREEPFVLASQAAGQHSAGDGLLKKAVHNAPQLRGMVMRTGLYVG
mgnify:CR=1 FL=1